MELTRIDWNKENYKIFKNYLNSLQEKEYQDFQKKLIPGENNIIGIRIPKLREISKKIHKGNWELFLEFCKPDSFEEIFINGCLIGLAKISYDDFIVFVDDYISLITNWAICDSFCSGLKQSKSFEEKFFPHIKSYITSKNPWRIRTGLILLLSHFIEEKYIYEILSLCNQVSSDEYYVKMGQAWLISTCYIKFKEITLDYLLNKATIEKWTYNKALSKITESKRISNEEKAYIKSLKIN